jgi:hypothetical protein
VDANEQIKLLEPIFEEAGFRKPSWYAKITDPKKFEKFVLPGVQHTLGITKRKRGTTRVFRTAWEAATQPLPKARPDVHLATSAQPGCYPVDTSTSTSIKEKDNVPGWARLTDETILQVIKGQKLLSGVWVKYCIDHDIPLHIHLMGFRPHKRFMMGKLLYMNAGRAGKTWWGHADMMLADDAARKMHYGNFTMYLKTVVTHPQYMLIHDDVFCSEYLGGEDISFWDPCHPDHRDEYISRDHMRDIFIIAVPADFDPLKSSGSGTCRYRDITGRLPDGLSADERTHKDASYPSAEAYASFWNWAHRAPVQSATGAMFYSGTNGSMKSNTIVFQEQQFLSNYKTGEFDQKIADCGHWGDRCVYPGSTDVLMGQEPYFVGAQISIPGGTGIMSTNTTGVPGQVPL